MWAHTRASMHMCTHAHMHVPLPEILCRIQIWDPFVPKMIACLNIFASICASDLWTQNQWLWTTLTSAVHWTIYRSSTNMVFQLLAVFKLNFEFRWQTTCNLGHSLGWDHLSHAKFRTHWIHLTTRWSTDTLFLVTDVERSVTFVHWQHQSVDLLSCQNFRGWADGWALILIHLRFEWLTDSMAI